MWAARIIAVWVCWQAGHAITLAQAPGNSPVSTAPRSAAPPPAVPPLPESPIRYFRRLLALSPEDLDNTLAGKPEAQRNVLKAKLREYTALPEDEREGRLRATELRWYLRPMMELAPANRAHWRAAVPEDLSALIRNRLAQWDGLTPEMRKVVLENDWIAQYFLRYESSTVTQREALLNQTSPALRARVEKEMARWQTLSPQQRQQMCSRFQQFFELPPEEKEQTLSNLSEAERNLMKKTLQAFGAMPPAQRRLCINSFSRFAGMTPEEQLQFLQNAERWKEMTPGERQKWRALVTQLPPLPPGRGQPPLPPPLPKQRSSAAIPAGQINLTNASP